MDFRIKQEGMVVAAGSGSVEAAKREAARYALTYAQDGPPVEVWYRNPPTRWKKITNVEVLKGSPND